MAHVLDASPTAKPSESPVPKPSTIVDYLSSSAQFSYFLRHLQKHNLIPVVNKLLNVTLFAPVNLAFVDDQFAINDTTDTLKRYFADERLSIDPSGNEDVILDSLYITKHYRDGNTSFPLKVTSTPNGAQVNDFADIVEANYYAKHQRSYIHTIDRLLPVPPTLCSMLMDSHHTSINGHSISFIKQLFQLAFTNIRGSGFQMSCEEYTANVSTILIPSDSVIDASLLDLQKKYYTVLFSGITQAHLKPSKDAIREVRADILQLLLNLLFPHVIGGNRHSNSTQKTALGNHSYQIIKDKDTQQLIFNGRVRTAVNGTSIVAADGLVHVIDVEDNSDSNVFSDLNIEAAEMIPRKALYAMHFSYLVKELKFRKLEYLIDGSTKNQTIVVEVSDRDDYVDDDAFLAAKKVSSNSFSNKQSMLYHFLEGAVDVHKELDKSASYRHLVFSKLCLRKRINSCFKVKVYGTVSEGRKKVLFNDDVRVSSLPIYASSDNIIYVADDEFLVPSSFKHTLADLISNEVVRGTLDHVIIDKESCLTTLNYLSQFSMLSLPENHKGYSAFLPCGNTVWDGRGKSSQQNYGSWKSLGLVMKYLESHPHELKDILKGFFLEDLVYSDFGLQDERELFTEVKTLRGDYVNISERYRSGDVNHLITVNHTSFSMPLNSDVLFSQGVIHITSKILLPDNFHVSLLNLVKTTEISSYPNYSFLHLVEQIPQLVDTLNLNEEGKPSEYSLLIPSPDLLKDSNISASYNRLSEFLELHLVPNTDVDTLLQCVNSVHHDSNGSFIFHTNHTYGNFRCIKNKATGETFLHLNREVSGFESSDHKVKIVSHGCTNVMTPNSSCVFLLDKPLKPEWFDAPKNFLHIHIGWISVCIGIIIGVILFGFVMTTLIVCLGSGNSRKKSEPFMFANEPLSPNEPSFMRVTSDEDFLEDHGYETDDDMMGNERDPILARGKGKRKAQNYYGATSTTRETPSAPRSIKGNSLLKNLNRDRDFPVLNM